MERENKKILLEKVVWIVRGQEQREGIRMEVRSPFDQWGRIRYPMQKMTEQRRWRWPVKPD